MIITEIMIIAIITIIVIIMMIGVIVIIMIIKYNYGFLNNPER